MLQVWTKQSSPFRESSIRRLLPQLPLRTGPPFLSTYPASEAQTTHHSVSLARLAWLPPRLRERADHTRPRYSELCCTNTHQLQCFGPQNPNNPQCFWENELVASRGRSAPLPDEAHMKGLLTQPVNPAKDISCPRTWGQSPVLWASMGSLGQVRPWSHLRVPKGVPEQEKVWWRLCASPGFSFLWTGTSVLLLQVLLARSAPKCLPYPTM